MYATFSNEILFFPILRPEIMFSRLTGHQKRSAAYSTRSLWGAYSAASARSLVRFQRRGRGREGMTRRKEQGRERMQEREEKGIAA